jgi:hypothetical protein
MPHVNQSPAAVSDNQLYELKLFNGPHADDPEIAAESVTCMPIEKLGRELCLGDWVHARFNIFDAESVWEVAHYKGRLGLTPLMEDHDLGVMPIDDDIEIKGFVTAYRMTRAH